MDEKTTYRIVYDDRDGVLMLSFGHTARNDEIVREAVSQVRKMKGEGILKGGGLLKINGPATLPAMTAITHEVAHLYETVAIFDPKMGKYVVSISHGPGYEPGDLIDEDG